MSALKSHRQAFYAMQQSLLQRDIDYSNMSSFHAIALSGKANTKHIHVDEDHPNVETGLSEVSESDYGSAQFAESSQDAASERMSESTFGGVAGLPQVPQVFNDGRSDPSQIAPAQIVAELRLDAESRLQMANNPDDRQFALRQDLNAVRGEGEAMVQRNDLRFNPESFFNPDGLFQIAQFEGKPVDRDNIPRQTPKEKSKDRTTTIKDRAVSDALKAQSTRRMMLYDVKRKQREDTIAVRARANERVEEGLIIVAGEHARKKQTMTNMMKYYEKPR